MKQHTEIPYWILLAHLPKWGTEKINRLVVKIVHSHQMDLETFFHLSETEWKSTFELADKDIQDLQNAKSELPNISFLAEDLLSQGFEVVPINSPEYSKTLKNNLKIKAPTVLYIKGNKQIMQENSVAIVGSRKADEISLQFTDNIAKQASEQYKVVVSGFAKGVDKQALDSALKYKGQSIIVLPQGIMTFGSGIKKYYKEITNGDVLVLSIFPPKAVWSVGLAMARNPIIYGLANEIYVAQSSATGGTWEGVTDGMKRGRTIFVRMPEKNEKNANLLLIEKGGYPIDLSGKPIKKEPDEMPETTHIDDEGNNANPHVLTDDLEAKITEVLNGKVLTAKQIADKLKINIPPKSLSVKLKDNPKIDSFKKGRLLHFRLKNKIKQGTLFE